MEPQIKIAFQNPDSRLFEINRIGSKEPPQVLSEEEFRTLQELMHDTKWIIVRWVKPPIPTWHPDHPKNQNNLN